MASTIPHHIIEDEDEFDWEAAVKEIDDACQSTKPSSSVAEQPSYCLPTEPLTKRHTASRQSTLEKYVLSTGHKSVLVENQPDRDRIKEKIGFYDGTSCVNIDSEAAKTWIYPINFPLRDYQLSIAKTAMFSNTLVALPTGLGKTFIAAVVMYNYFRWFPEGKIVFAAPSRPLVMQQIEACHNIGGIPQEWAIDMTGQMSPTKRASLWKAKRVFFVTPQVLERDIQSGESLNFYSFSDV